MKVSAQGRFWNRFFLTILMSISALSRAQLSSYPLGTEASSAPPASPSLGATPSPYSKPAYPGMAPGMSSQMSGQPKDLSGRFGLGVTNLGPKATPQVSLDWQTSRSTSVEFNVGFDSLKDNSTMLVTGRFSRNMFIEENLHFFLFLGGGFSSGQSSGKSQSGLILEAGAGARFFLPGQPNLGWHSRFGLFYKSAGDSRMLTTGVVGFHYYF